MRNPLELEFARFVVNGLTAAAVHFAMLTLLIEVAELPSAGLANVIAALFGITASFIGNRYFVFRGHANGIGSQLWRFGALYLLMAGLHGGVLYVWTDLLRLDYRIGFLIASALQMLLSYSGNKLLVFVK